MRASVPWTGLTALVWILLLPHLALKIVACFLVWIPAIALFVWSTAFLAQQFSIYNSQLKGGLVGSVGDSVVGVLTGVPVAICALIGLTSLLLGKLMVAGAAFLSYVVVVPLLSRFLAVAGIERLPYLRQKVQEVGRKVLGIRRNRWVPIWSDNPVVVRERTRDAARTPGGLLGALLFQLPALAFWACILSPMEKSLSLAAPGSNLFFVALLVCGCVQLLRAGNRCCGAIVGEVESKTLETMQNTCLHAREYARGWLEVGALPLIVENCLLLALLLALKHADFDLVSLSALALFLLAPLAGASVGLYSSLASNREQASRRRSEVMTWSLGGWLAGCFVIALLCPGLLALVWAPLLLLYVGIVGWLCWRQVLRRIEV